MSLPPIKYKRDEVAEDKKARPIVYGIVVIFIICMFFFFSWLFADGGKKTSALSYCQSFGGDLTSWGFGSKIALCGWVENMTSGQTHVMTVDGKPYDHLCGIKYFEDSNLWYWQHWNENASNIWDKCKLP